MLTRFIDKDLELCAVAAKLRYYEHKYRLPSRFVVENYNGALRKFKKLSLVITKWYLTCLVYSMMTGDIEFAHLADYKQVNMKATAKQRKKKA